jgi:hypothetical protein
MSNEETLDATEAAYLRKYVAELEAELLRVRTTGHAAAHELDNIAIECGLGHSPQPGTVAAHVREMKKLAELYPLAWEECQWWRGLLGEIDPPGTNSTGWYHHDVVHGGWFHSDEADAHDKARADRGMGQ